MGQLCDLTPQAIGFFRCPPILAAMGFLVGTVLHWIFRKRGASMRANLALASMLDPERVFFFIPNRGSIDKLREPRRALLSCGAGRREKRL